MKRTISRAFRTLQASLDRSLDAEAPKFCAEGVWVIDRYSLDAQSDLVLEEMRRALWFIHEADAVTWRRMVRHVDRITVTPLRALGYFARDRREILVSGSLVAAGNPSDVALTLVHEIAHARVAATGYTKTTREQRTREEVLCERRVRAFIGRVALKDPAWAEYRDQYVAQPLPTGLSTHELWELRLRDDLEGLKHLGTPAWIVRGYEWLVRRRLRLARGATRR